jgi:hypothetical protein
MLSKDFAAALTAIGSTYSDGRWHPPVDVVASEQYRGDRHPGRRAGS